MAPLCDFGFSGDAAALALAVVILEPACAPVAVLWLCPVEVPVFVLGVEAPGEELCEVFGVVVLDFGSIEVVTTCVVVLSAVTVVGSPPFEATLVFTVIGPDVGAADVGGAGAVTVDNTVFSEITVLALTTVGGGLGWGALPVMTICRASGPEPPLIAKVVATAVA